MASNRPVEKHKGRSSTCPTCEHPIATSIDREKGEEEEEGEGSGGDNYPPFDPQMVGHDYTVIAAGKRGTGKTVALCWLLSELKDNYEEVFVITDTAMNGFWQQFVKEKFILGPEVANDFIDAVIKRQSKLVERETMGHGPDAPTILIILDDIAHKTELTRYSQSIDKLFVAGRHIRVAVWATTQYINLYHPPLRTNADTVFLFPERNHTTFKAQHDTWLKTAFDMAPVREAMHRLNRICKDHRFFVVNQSDGRGLDVEVPEYSVGHAPTADFTFFCGSARDEKANREAIERRIEQLSSSDSLDSVVDGIGGTGVGFDDVLDELLGF